MVRFCFPVEVCVPQDDMPMMAASAARRIICFFILLLLAYYFVLLPFGYLPNVLMQKVNERLR